ncbi:hypothetical protein SAICODRAFT_27099 [Saitoella complicata NRRL Y-17804]|uniref:uncharacterized protein n=1 Tax=Saitoella complicata (strain BCRC 22490 / CBS 7301 / JCM 7358 / NBRC 10748 / NRRL Y-17804) TaxID=698492 RepID=UPI0008668F3D|nr:uncharacterized protein SAICODRAFT_27099 [Saitoella complicata NRRL Y-17804]ODQ51040.1 hypothetical protein SAICODRAFT_27099 [Saitoella complicata NRRL Y-17804]
MTTPNIYTAVMHTEHTKATGMNPLHLPIGLSDRKLRRNSFTSSYGAFLSSHAHVISDKISGVAADVILHLYNDHKEKKERHHERRSSSSSASSGSSLSVRSSSELSSRSRGTSPLRG